MSLGILFLVALLSIPVYLTGVAASEIMQDRPGVSAAVIHTHEDAALSAFVVMELTGAAAGLALWQFRRFSRPPRGTLLSVVFLSVVSFVLMAQAANLGGVIRHPEVVSLQETATTGEPLIDTAWLKTASVRSFVNDTDWVWPACEAIHFIGLGLSFGVVLLLNLRMLGMMKSVAFADLHRTLPWERRRQCESGISWLSPSNPAVCLKIVSGRFHLFFRRCAGSERADHQRTPVR